MSLSEVHTVRAQSEIVTMTDQGAGSGTFVWCAEFQQADLGYRTVGPFPGCPLLTYDALYADQTDMPDADARSAMLLLARWVPDDDEIGGWQIVGDGPDMRYSDVVIRALTRPEQGVPA